MPTISKPTLAPLGSPPLKRKIQNTYEKSNYSSPSYSSPKLGPHLKVSRTAPKIWSLLQISSEILETISAMMTTMLLYLTYRQLGYIPPSLAIRNLHPGAQARISCSLVHGQTNWRISLSLIITALLHIAPSLNALLPVPVGDT
jgi:hypothetical protein